MSTHSLAPTRKDKTMTEKLLTIFTIAGGSVMMYLSGSELVYYNGYGMPAIYTASVLVLGAGIRSVLKGK